MPNTPVQAAAEGLPKITRRGLIAAIPATVATMDPVAASVAQDAAHPWQRARDLANELSLVLDEGDDGYGNGPGGKWTALVQPASRTKYGVAFQSVDAARSLHTAISLKFTKLIDDHKAARKAFCEACDGVDKVLLGREPSKAAQRRYNRANKAEERTLIAICAYRPMGRAEALAKVRYLIPYCRGGELYEMHVEALIFSEVL